MKLRWALMLWTSFSLMAKPVTISFSEDDFAPFYFVKDGEWQGVAYDYMQHLLSESGLKIQGKRMPWKRTLKSLQSGEVDLVTVIYQTPARKAFLYFSEQAYFMDDVVLFCTHDCELGYDGSLHSIAEHGIHVVRGYSYGPKFDNAPLNTSEVDTELKLHFLARAQRVRLGASFYSTLTWSALYRDGVVRLLQPPVDRVGVHFAISKKGRVTPAERARIEAANRAFLASPDYLKLLKRYQMLQGSVRR